jgi:hypothetical protein
MEGKLFMETGFVCDEALMTAAVLFNKYMLSTHT